MSDHFFKTPLWVWCAIRLGSRWKSWLFCWSLVNHNPVSSWFTDQTLGLSSRMLEMPVFKYQWSDSKASTPPDSVLTSFKQILWLQSPFPVSMSVFCPQLSSSHFSFHETSDSHLCIFFFFLRSNRGTRSRRLAPLWEWIQVPPLPLDLTEPRLPHLLRGNNNRDHHHLLRTF